MADIGWDATFGISLAKNGTYTPVAEVVAITPPPMTRDAVETTHLKSTSGWRTYIAGLKSLGEAKITINWEASITDVLFAAFADEDSDYEIIAPNGVKLRWSGFMTDVTPPEMTPDGLMQATATIRPSGLMTVTS